MAFEDINDDSIDDIEKYVRTKFRNLMKNDNEEKKKSFFGEYYANPEKFEFCSKDRSLILKCANYVNYLIAIEKINSKFESLCVEDNSVPDFAVSEGSVANDDIEKRSSRTHYFLSLLLADADKNIQRKKEGYRFDDTIKKLASYYRMIAGPLAYETLQRNLELSLPSISSVNRYIRRMNTNIIEGVLRTEELLNYLQERNLPLIIAISEDATRLTGTVQYDARTNQLMGFALPIKSENGMPIPFSFNARNADEMMQHFSNGNDIGNYVNVMMAQPLADVSPFCLLLFSTNSKYSSQDVSNRWDYIEKELHAVNIEVLVFSSDADPKYLSAMRRLSLLGIKSPIFTNKTWFNCGMGFLRKPFQTQDTVHIGGKMRNQMLKTRKNPRKLAFGKKYFVRIDQLDFLVKNFTKDQHQLTPSVLNPIDRMNFPSVLRMCDANVINLLKENVKNSVGTVIYLEMMRDIIESYRDKDLHPIDRIQKIWYAVFICRLWREYVESKSHLTLEANFLTHNCYTCIELNAHCLVLIMLYLKERDMPHLFRPEFFESQPCEQMFRQIRSFTSTYSTVVNCSIKEIVSRINKIQLQSEIALNCKDFEFPRIKIYSENTIKNRVVHSLPSKEDICCKIEECEKKAIQFAIQISLRDKESVNKPLCCRIKPLVGQNQIDQECEEAPRTPPQTLSILGNIQMTDYSNKFPEKPNETSSYIEIFCGPNRKRMVVKKTSLCWLLREDTYKLSSDRLMRVRSVCRKNVKSTVRIKKKPSKKIKFNIYKKKKNGLY